MSSTLVALLNAGIPYIDANWEGLPSDDESAEDDDAPQRIESESEDGSSSEREPGSDDQSS